MRGRAILVVSAFGLLGVLSAGGEEHPKRRFGQEIAVPVHLNDDDLTSKSIADLLRHGSLLFSANWTEQEGAGRPLMKGTTRALVDQSQPLSGARAFNRFSGPDANSCYGCHNAPYGISGGGGDFVTNVFVLGQRFDFLNFDATNKRPTGSGLDEAGKPVDLNSAANIRATTGMMGAGYLEMLAREMTADLQAIRDGLRPGETGILLSKGVTFGELTRRSDGMWDVSAVQGLPRQSTDSPTPLAKPTLIIRPWHQSANVVSLREFSNNAFHQHHGIQSVERFGLDTDPDGDGVVNELTRADVTAVSLFQAGLQVPGRVIPRDPELEAMVLKGERAFNRIGCAGCHVPELPLTQRGWKFEEPGPYNPPTNARAGDMPAVTMDLSDPALPLPRLHPASERPDVIYVPAYTDFKLHDISDPNDPGAAEPLDQNETVWSAKFRKGNRMFLTKRLWGAANEPPYFHHGLFTTMRQAVLAHHGEALSTRLRFEKLSGEEQDAVIEFLKTLQVLPPGTRDPIVDENYRPRQWPPATK